MRIVVVEQLYLFTLSIARPFYSFSRQGETSCEVMHEKIKHWFVWKAILSTHLEFFTTISKHLEISLKNPSTSVLKNAYITWKPSHASVVDHLPWLLSVALLAADVLPPLIPSFMSLVRFTHLLSSFHVILPAQLVRWHWSAIAETYLPLLSISRLCHSRI